MSIAYERLIQHLEHQEIHFQASGERETIMAAFRGRSGSFRVYAHVDEDDDVFQVFGLVPNAVPEGSRPAIAETIARANYGLRVGKFELDLSDGEVRFQAYHILSCGILDDDTIHRLLGTTLAMLDRYVPAILSVIYANESPEDAIRCVEADLAKPDEQACS